MDPIIGAFLFSEEWQSLDSNEADTLFGKLKTSGVNAVFTESETYREDLIDRAHRADLRWIASIAVYSDHAHQHRLLKERPELWPVDETGRRREPMEWYVGVTPTFQDYSASRLLLAERICREHNIDGFMLDFIRWPIHWELELKPSFGPRMESSFDAHTLARFGAETGLTLPPLEPVRWIREKAAAEWVAFKCRVITDVVRECVTRIRLVRGTSLSLGVFTLPLLPTELESVAGQKLSDLAPLVDWIAPMVYHAIVHRPVAWVSDIIRETADVAPRQVLPVVQISSESTDADWGQLISTAEREQVLRLARHADGTCGLVMFPGRALLRETQAAHH